MICIKLSGNSNQGTFLHSDSIGGWYLAEGLHTSLGPVLKGFLKMSVIFGFKSCGFFKCKLRGTSQVAGWACLYLPDGGGEQKWQIRGQEAAKMPDHWSGGPTETSRLRREKSYTHTHIHRDEKTWPHLLSVSHQIEILCRTMGVFVRLRQRNKIEKGGGNKNESQDVCNIWVHVCVNMFS